MKHILFILGIVVFVLSGCDDARQQKAIDLIDVMQESIVAQDNQERALLHDLIRLVLESEKQTQLAHWHTTIEQLRVNVILQCADKRKNLIQGTEKNLQATVHKRLASLQQDLHIEQIADNAERVQKLQGIIAGILAEIHRRNDEIVTHIDQNMTMIQQDILSKLEQHRKQIPPEIRTYDTATITDTVLAKSYEQKTTTSAHVQGLEEIKTYLESPGPLTLFFQGFMPDTSFGRKLTKNLTETVSNYREKTTIVIDAHTQAWQTQLSKKLTTLSLSSLLPAAD